MAETTPAKDPAARAGPAVDKKHRSLLRRAFGDDIGGLMEVMVGIPAAIGLFMLATQLPFYILQRVQKPSDEVKLLARLPANSHELVKELADVQAKTQHLLSKLESDAKAAEALVDEKRRALADLQKKSDLLQLTPDQRRMVEEYNRTVSPADVGFFEWVRRRVTWYELSASIVIAWFFYWRGLRSGRKKERYAAEAARLQEKSTPT